MDKPGNLSFLKYLPKTYEAVVVVCSTLPVQLWYGQTRNEVLGFRGKIYF